MSTDTEALRAKYERQCRGLDLSRNEDGVYTDEFVYVAWIHYREGHAAAKAETADPVVGRWYFVTTDGAATLCVDEADARESAAEADIAFPRMAPHHVTQLVSASQLAAAVTAERERATDVLAAFIPEWDGQEAVDGGDLIRMLIGAIRAGAKEPSDG